MKEGDLLIITGNEINKLFQHKEAEIINAVSDAYQCHGRQEDYLPHSIFLRFPDSEKNRIIGLPAYLGGNFQKSGMKWIASYPENHQRGLDRATASIILNSVETGIPLALLEGSVISAKRTAASAALAAKHLVCQPEISKISLIGCGLINFETLRFLLEIFPTLQEVLIYDTEPQNAAKFVEKCKSEFRKLEFEITDQCAAALKESLLVCLATTAVSPHIDDISICLPGTTILHTSLRDFTPNVILSAANVVDDIDHASRAQTSIHLAEMEVNNRDFIRCSLPEILLGEKKGRINDEEIVIFGPFGLGILDIALSDLVYKIAQKENIGAKIEAFLPDYWLNRT